MTMRAFFIKLPSALRMAVVVGVLLGTVAAWAAPAATRNVNLNDLGQYSITGQGETRFFAAPGSTEIQILNARHEIVATRPVKTEQGVPLAVYELHFVPATGRLLVTTAAQAPVDVYSVDPATGTALYLSTARGADTRAFLRYLASDNLSAARTLAPATARVQRRSGSLDDEVAPGTSTAAPRTGRAISGVFSTTGHVSISVDAMGTLSGGGNVQVMKPAGATVRNAFLTTASTGSWEPTLPDGCVQLNGTPIVWTSRAPSSIGSENGWAEVTGLVTPLLNPAPAGMINVPLTESPDLVDGSILIVIFNDPAVTENRTVILLFGAQNVAGETFQINLSEPLDLTDPAAHVYMGLGISYGWQNGGSQFSTVDVNGDRLTTSAGGWDDGEDANYALITVGGIGDSYANPADPMATPPFIQTYDDELYDLLPFVSDGDDFISVHTANPSNDDNIFFAWLETSVPAAIGESVILTPPSAAPTVNTTHSLFATLNNDLGEPLLNKTVHFSVLSGPNAGLTGSAVTNAAGIAAFSYSSTITGLDNVQASFYSDALAMDVQSNVATVDWQAAIGGTCGAMDIVFAVDVTGSMGGAIGNVIAELPNIIAAANAASGGDVRYALLTFHDQVHVIHNLTANAADVVAGITALTAGGGSGEPEASDETLREIITNDALCTDGSEFTEPFRPGAQKIVVLITDARPAGCDDDYTAGVDDVNAHQRALDALAADILISAVFVPTWLDYEASIVSIMGDYATTTGGQYTRVNEDGTGTGAAITAIIEACGGSETPDDCDGPHCNTVQPIGYTAVSGLISDAVMQMTEAGELKLSWTPVNGAHFYQVYMGSEFDSPQNWAPVGTPLDATLIVPQEILDRAPEGRSQYFFVQAKQVTTEPLSTDLGCWPLDEGTGTLAEDFAQNNDGTIYGAEWQNGPSGHPGLHFEYGDYVQVPNDVEFYGQPLQVEACVSIASYPTVQTGSYYIFACHRYTTWFQGFGLRIDVNGRLLSEVWDEELHNWRTLWASPAKRVPLNEPFNVTAVINGNLSMILLNGEVVAAGVQHYESITNGFSMTIGAHNYNSDRYQYHMRGDIHWLKVSQF